jgi:hypothetical protein
MQAQWVQAQPTEPLVFSSPGPKGHVSFCHHFASVIGVVCKLHIFIFSETTEQIWTKLGRNVHWEVLYQICYFGADQKSNMAARANNVF